MASVPTLLAVLCAPVIPDIGWMFLKPCALVIIFKQNFCSYIFFLNKATDSDNGFACIYI